jgi:hypothetical protein
MNKVSTQWIQMSTLFVQSLLQWTYTQKNVACMKLTYISSQTIIRVVWLMPVSLTESNYQAIFGCRTKNEAADLNRIGLKITWKTICAQLRNLAEAEVKNDCTHIKRPADLFLSLASKTRGRTADVS